MSNPLVLDLWRQLCQDQDCQILLFWTYGVNYARTKSVKSSCFGPMASTMPGPRAVKSSCFGPMASTMPGPRVSNPLVLDLWRQLCQDQELSNPLVLDLWRQLCQDQELSNPLVLDLWRQLCQDPVQGLLVVCYCTDRYRVNESYVRIQCKCFIGVAII